MEVAVFSSKSYDECYLTEANQVYQHELQFYSAHLNPDTVSLAAGASIVCCFVNDCLNAQVLSALAAQGIKFIALRSAGYNHVDLDAAKALGIKVASVPAYSPYAVAEHAVGLVLVLNRKIHRAHTRVREGDFSLHGLLGFDLHGKTVGVIGTGKIGSVFARIMQGFGCHLLGYDIVENAECLQLGMQYVELDELLKQSDILSLHCPLTPETFHLIDVQALAKTKPGVMIINTSRGKIIDTVAAIDALKRQHIGYLGLDVYEEEADLFFEDLSDQIIQDDVFARLQTFPNVLITSHQAFFTKEAVRNIAATTLANINAFATGQGELHLVG